MLRHVLFCFPNDLLNQYMTNLSLQLFSFNISSNEYEVTVIFTSIPTTSIILYCYMLGIPTNIITKTKILLVDTYSESYFTHHKNLSLLAKYRLRQKYLSHNGKTISSSDVFILLIPYHYVGVFIGGISVAFCIKKIIFRRVQTPHSTNGG